MIKRIQRGLLGLVSLILSVAIVAQAQAECNVDAAQVIEVVEDVCNELGDNEVCYGNFEVSAIAQENSPSFTFEAEGDLASLGYIRSLFLSALNTETETWGIAQMRLIASTGSGTQNIDMLLFGNVEVTNTVPPTVEMDALVGQYAANIRNTPSPNAVILASAPTGSSLKAVGRIADNSWIRVLVPDTGAVGWVSASLLTPANAEENFETLAVQDASSPYFGAMQAFYFTDNGGSGCGDITSDGLLIQTPEGTARVTLLINEVSIELIPGQNGSTALVTGNADAGMTVSVIDGSAFVETGGNGFFVDSSQQTNVPLTPNLSPAGAPTMPQDYDVVEMAGLPLLPTLRDPSLPIIRSTSNTGATSSGGGGGSSGSGGGSGDGGNGNGNANGNANGNGNGNANGNRNGN